MNERFDEVLDEAMVLRELDAARAEVWVSGLLAEWVDIDDLLARLATSSRSEALAIARAAVAIVPEAEAVAAVLAARGIAEPPWAFDVGSAVGQLAWEIVDPFSGNVSVVVEYEHADGVRHSMLVEIEDGGAVDIHFGPPGLVDDAFDESDTRSLSVREWPVDRAIARIAAAMEHTGTDDEAAVTEEFVMNAALVTARVGGSTGGTATPVAGAPIDILVPGADPPTRPRREALDAEGDAAACRTLRAALNRELAVAPPTDAIGAAAARVRAELATASTSDLHALALDVGLADPASVDDATLLARLAGAFVVPGRLGSFAPAERDAIRGLEWADWLGAVIPLVRAGAGADADPVQLVRNINRCPEVTTTVPKRDVPVVADVFARTLHAWELTGALDDDGRLTALGAWLVPRGLLAAWGSEPIA